MGEIREDQKAKLYFKAADDSEKEVECVIKEVKNDRISLAFPEKMMEYADYLTEGEELPVRIFTPSGVKLFDTIILNSPFESEFVIEYVDNYIQIQRREYSRMLLETKLIVEREDYDNVITHTLDISGGSVRFYYEGEFLPKESVGCLLYLPMQIRSIQAKGVIIKNHHLAKNEHVLFFTKIDERDRDKIVQKTFEIETMRYRPD